MLKNRSHDLWTRSLVSLLVCFAAAALSAAGAREPITGTATGRLMLGMNSNPHILENPAYAPALIGTGAGMCRVDVSTFSVIRPRPGNDPEQWNWAPMERIRQLHKQYPQLAWLCILGYGSPWAQDARFKNVPGSGNSQPQGVEMISCYKPCQSLRELCL